MPRNSHEDHESDILPFWSGTITFGLVSVPVDLYPAVRTRRVASRMFGPNGAPLTRRFFSEKGELLKDSDIVRGFELDDGRFIVVTDAELEKLEPRKSREIDLRRFVDRDSIPASMFERHYVLAPGGDSTKAYHLLAQAMERDNRAGIATYVMRGREYLVAIYAEGGLLFGATLHFIDEIRSPKSIGLPPVRSAPDPALKQVRAALRKLSATSLDTTLFTDPEENTLLNLARKKHAKSRDIIEMNDADEEPERTDVLDIMSILKQRMQSGVVNHPATGKATRHEIAELSRDELYERAKELNIKGRSTMSRTELVRAIAAAE